MAAFPESYYHDPSSGSVEELRWEEKKKQIKAERKIYMRKTGCRGCYHSNEFGWCGLDHTPHGGGWCSEWWDARTGKAPK